MNLVFGVFFLLASVLGIPSASPGGSVVLIADPTHPTVRGAGVIIGRDNENRLLILTARHLAIHDGLTIGTRDGRTLPVLDRYLQPTTVQDWDGDVALLVAPDFDGSEIANLAPSEPREYAPLVVIGNPMDNRFETSHGSYISPILVSWHSETDERSIDPEATIDDIQGLLFDSFQIHCEGCRPGDSGGGVFNAAGNLVGIMFGLEFSQNAQDATFQSVSGNYNEVSRSTAYVVPIQRAMTLAEQFERR